MTSYIEKTSYTKADIEKLAAQIEAMSHDLAKTGSLMWGSGGAMKDVALRRFKRKGEDNRPDTESAMWDD